MGGDILLEPGLEDVMISSCTNYDEGKEREGESREASRIRVFIEEAIQKLRNGTSLVCTEVSTRRKGKCGGVEKS